MSKPVVAAAIRVLEVLFAVGIVGSALVVILTTIEDLRTMFGSNGEKK